MQEPLPTAPVPARRRMTKRALFIGSTIAILAMAGLGWLAWSLTHDDAPAAAGPGGGRPGGGFRAGGPGGPGGRGATTVGVAVAESASIPVVIDALGTVVPRATVRVRPQVSGVLQTVKFDEGQMVKKGQLLATIDARTYEAQLQQAIGARQRNEAQLQAARVTLQRYQTLLGQDSIARQDVDTQAAQVKQLEAALVTDRANEQSARLNLAYTNVVAPISGRVGLRTVDVGNVVGPNDTNGVAVITQLTPIDVEFAVPQDHASWLQHNAGAFMEVKAFDRTRTTLLDTGAFASLDNQIDSQTGTVKAKARFNNARMQLFPAQFVNVQLQLRTIDNAVVVPVTALRQGGSGEYVFVLQEDRTVKLRNVVRGQPMGERIQVASGLAIGEKVITEGADRLRDGSRVTLPGDAPGGREGGGRRRGASGAGGGGGGGGGGGFGPRAPGASQPFTGASAAQGSPPWAGASAMAGARANRPAASGAASGGPTDEERAARRERMANMSPEERAAMRDRLANMSPEERAALRERFANMSPEEREAARARRRASQAGGTP